MAAGSLPGVVGTTTGKPCLSPTKRQGTLLLQRLNSRGTRVSKQISRSVSVGIADTIAVPETLVSVSPGAAVVACLQKSIDPTVLASTASASLKLLIICVAVRWLSETKRIPSNTSVVLAQVSFQLLIPCMLFVKVVSILAMQSDPILLIGMAVAAITQIGIGAFWGSLLTPLIDEKTANSMSFFGFQPWRFDKASRAVADATSRAIGVPSTKEALLPKPEQASKGFKSLITAASAFQNSFTLPAVFLLSLLPAGIADRAVAYLGLYLLAWSPCLWSFGLYLIQRGYRIDQELASSENGLVKQEKVSFSWGQMLKGTLNPPVLAVLFAACLGLTPLGRALFSPKSTMINLVSSLPFELSVVLYGFQNVYEVIQMLGEGTLPIQTLVLAASLLQPGDAPRSKEVIHGFWNTVLNFFKSSSGLETRALLVLSIIRFVLAPVSVLVLFKVFSRVALFGPLLADPILLFVISVQSVMPSAQNLLIALQLSPLTQGAAPGLAGLLLKLYALAILPVTLWVTGFASHLAIPLA